MSTRPTPQKVRRYIWLEPNKTELPGIALIGDRGLMVHLTPAEAIDLATNIVNIIDQHPELRQDGTTK